MIQYLWHVKKPHKMAPSYFTARWNEMLWQTVLLETHYESNPDKAELKLMFIRENPKPYHQKFIAQGKNFDQMSELDIATYFQVIHQ